MYYDNCRYGLANFLAPWRLYFCLLASVYLIPFAQAQGSFDQNRGIVLHGTVVTMDAGFHVFEQGAVAVRGERIVAVGPARELAARYSGAKTIDTMGRIVMPGLVKSFAMDNVET